MKRFLLGTSALISMAAISTAANAQGPGVTVGGFTDFQVGFSDQDSPFDTTVPFDRDTHFRNDTEVHILVDGTADNGLQYGAVIELEADVTGSESEEGGVNADRTYIFLQSSSGRVEMGANVGAEHALKVDAATIARATGGVDGDYYRFVKLDGVGGTASFITSPDLPSQTSGTSEDANKITIYTPRMSGVQAGASYTLDSGEVGTATGFSGEMTAGNNENIFSLGINYTGQYDQVGVQASATGEFGESEVASTEDLSAWQAGVVVSTAGFSVAGSYGDWGDSGLAVSASSDDQTFWTLGGAYESGPFGVSVTWLDSEAGDNDFNNVVVGADYQLAPGLVPYVEVAFFDADESGTTTDNDGTVVLVGSQLNF